LGKEKRDRGDRGAAKRRYGARKRKGSKERDAVVVVMVMVQVKARS